MLKKEVKNKVGRPKLADTKLKKKSYIMLGISALLILILLSGGLVSLNILPKFGKVKGSVPIYKTYSQGDKFCLDGDKECFYTMEDNGDTVTALAEWNLNIGDNKIPNAAEGIQNEDAKGYVTTGTMYGNLEFSNTNYWSDSVNNYPADVFNENSNLWQPLQNYQTYLKNDLDKKSVVATLLDITQAEKLGCSRDSMSCENAPSWVYQTSYWLLSASNFDQISCIATFNYYGQGYFYEGLGGLRPVITIDKSDFAEIIGYEGADEEEAQSTTNEDNQTYKVGDEFCLDTECFYTISDNGDTVTGLAKYNLLVGNIVDTSTWEAIEIPTSTEGYGLQNEKAVGATIDENWNVIYTSNSIGISFSESYYWDDDIRDAWVLDSNSNLYEEINNYKNRLQGLGYKNVEVSVLSYDDVTNLGCDADNDTCKDAPEWVYSTSYLLGSAHDEHRVWMILNNNAFIYDDYSFLGAGLRPVVTVSKSDLNKKEEVKETKREDKKTVVNNTTKKETVATTKTSKKVVATTKTEEKKEETTTTTTVGSINKVVKKEEVKTSNPIVPIGLGIGSVGAIAGIGYGIYLLKTK